MLASGTPLTCSRCTTSPPQSTTSVRPWFSSASMVVVRLASLKAEPVPSRCSTAIGQLSRGKGDAPHMRPAAEQDLPPGPPRGSVYDDSRTGGRAHVECKADARPRRDPALGGVS